jgi:hypothetical protein
MQRRSHEEAFGNCIHNSGNVGSQPVVWGKHGWRQRQDCRGKGRRPETVTAGAETTTAETNLARACAEARAQTDAGTLKVSKRNTPA